MMVCLYGSGCHNPARQNTPQIAPGTLEAQWRKELIPGRKADRALAYLLTQGFNCRVTRDERANVLQIVATLPNAVRDASGHKQNWTIDIAIKENAIQTTEITPVSSSW